MESEKIIKKMEELAETIHYEWENITYLVKAMCVNKLDNGNTSNKEYSNGSLATLGDAVFKLIITEKLYREGKNSEEITNIKRNIENNISLHEKTLKYNLQNFAYNDQFFFDEAPEHLKLPNPGHDMYIEAIIGAIYLDKGLDYCKDWVKSNHLDTV